VLHTRPSEFAGGRELLQLGAELYGHAGVESEIEIVRLMLAVLEGAGLRGLYLDLGHVGVFRALAREAALSEGQEHELFDALQRKARPEVAALLARYGLNPDRRTRLAGLLDLNGGPEVLERARALLQGAPAAAGSALADLEALAAAVGRAYPDLALYFDLAELSGYRYYTGVVFSVFAAGHGQALAKGGRYDGIGRAFGRERAATGFSTDLRFLLKLLPPEAPGRGAVYAPAEPDAALARAIERLRAAGERVVVALPGTETTAAGLGCDRALVRAGGAWTVKTLG
jgi:ATP phosphoribosyltransferase regulatory subunit